MTAPHLHGWTPIPLTAIEPRGWLRLFLENQRDGLTGHLEAAGYPFDTKGWRAENLRLGDRGGIGWWPYEQVAYWVDGMIRCGILLGDDKLKIKARRQIDHVLDHPDRDGYLGPDCLKEMKGPNGSERWPMAVFFRALIADQQHRPSKSVLRKLVRHYLSGTAPHDTNRNVCNIEIMTWLYEQTGDRRLLDMAVTAYRRFQEHDAKDGATVKNMLSGKRIGDHGPRHMELFKLGAVLYRVTGDRTLLKASLNANRKLVRDHMLVDGVPSTTEHLRGIYSTAGHETCVISDYLWSLGWLLQVTGDATHADAMETICFNALPGAVTHDFRALQYFSGPNQVIAGPQTNHHPHGLASTHVSFRPNPGTECCPGNVHRAMPAYIGRMWMDDGKGGVVACLYGAGAVTTKVAGRNVAIEQETDYPFSDRITFRFSCRAPVRMRFSFRIPGWCRDASATINGKPLKRRLTRGTFVAVNRTFRDGDRIDLVLPMEPRVVKGPEGGVAVAFGPLVMSLRIRERHTVVTDDRSTPEFPAWTMEPESPWNFALDLAGGARLPSIRVYRSPLKGNPWEPGNSPLAMEVDARRIAGWRLIRRKRLVQRHGDWKRVHEGNIVFMPPLPDAARIAAGAGRGQTVELVPLGATNLRVTWFPVVRG